MLLCYMRKRLPLVLILLSVLVLSCKEELKYTKEELYDKAKGADPQAQFLLPKSISEGVNCSDYGDACASGYRVKVYELELIAVEFNTEEDAKQAAKRFRGYYTRNWLLDDVAGEPILERFVQEHLGAKKHP